MANGRASGEKNSFEHMSWCGHNSRLQMVDVFWSLSTWSGKFCSLLPLLPCTWTVVWGKHKQTSPPPTSLHLGICRTHQLTDQLVAWLIDCYRQVGVRAWPHHSRTQAPSVFTSLRNFRCQNQFINPFTGQKVGGLGKKLNFSLNSVDWQSVGFTGCHPRDSAVVTCRLYMTN